MREFANHNGVSDARNPCLVGSFNNATIYDDLLPDDEDILRAMAKHPIMIHRPILAHEGRAIIGRPPEDILTLLDGPPPPSAADVAKATAALEALGAATVAALDRGVDPSLIERSLLRLAAELHMRLR